MALVDILYNLTLEIFRHFVKGYASTFFTYTKPLYMFNYFLVLQIQKYVQTKQKVHLNIY